MYVTLAVSAYAPLVPVQVVLLIALSVPWLGAVTMRKLSSQSSASLAPNVTAVELSWFSATLVLETLGALFVATPNAPGLIPTTFSVPASRVPPTLPDPPAHDDAPLPVPQSVGDAMCAPNATTTSAPAAAV